MNAAKKEQISRKAVEAINYAFNECKTEDEFFEARKILVKNGFDVDFVQALIMLKK